MFVIQTCDIDVNLHLDSMWCIWKKKNACIFKDCERNIKVLKLYFFRTLFDWMSVIDLFS